MESCSAFDYQIVPLMNDFLRTLDVNMDYKCQLIKSQEVVTSAQINKAGISTTTTINGAVDSANARKGELDSTFVQGIVGDTTNPNDLINENDLS